MNKDEVDALAEKCHHGYSEWNIDLYRFANLVAEEERARMAKVIGQLSHIGSENQLWMRDRCVAAIHALSDA